MGFLLDTDIEEQVREKISGLVARAGGSVDQLVDYRRCVVEDINIPDGGFGEIWKRTGIAVSRNLFPFLERSLRQEIDFLRKGHRVSRDRKTLIMDMHDAHTRKDLHARYDCSISSNLLEHSPNPIWLLLNFHFITKLDGYQFHAIPHYRHTYDKFRVPTPLEHLMEDFERHADRADTTHTEDYRQSAVDKDGWQRKFHERYPLKYPFIHFHVFDEQNTKALMELLFEDSVVDVYKTEVFSDNVVFFRNSLNRSFVERYRDTIRSYAGLQHIHETRD